MPLEYEGDDVKKGDAPVIPHVPDWNLERELADNRRYDELAARVAKLEKRGRFLESMTEERWLMAIVIASVALEFLLPLLQRKMKANAE